MGSNLPSFPCEDARESGGGEFERRVRRALQMKNVQKIRGSGKVGGGGVIKENWETNLRGERRDVYDVDRSDARGSPSHIMRLFLTLLQLLILLQVAMEVGETL